MDKILTEIIGRKQCVTKREYKICMTALFGYAPSDLEVAILFQDYFLLPVADLKKIIKYHNTDTDKELKVIEMFTILDSEGKGFIEILDVYQIWKNQAPFLSWDYIASCFREISIDNKIVYDSFKDMYLSLIN